MDTTSGKNNSYIPQGAPEKGIQVFLYGVPSPSENSTQNDSGRTEHIEPPFDFVVMWVIAVVVVALSLMTILGNLSVIVVYSMSKELQKFSNNFIISLAVADLMIGCLMPINLVVTISGGWPYHQDSCEVYASIQAALCYVSFLSILLVSIERWWCIHWPLVYRVKQSRRKAVLVITSAWTVTFLMFGPTNLVYKKLTGFQYEILTTRLMCTAQLQETPLRASIMAAVGFGLPLLLLVTCNSTIYFKIARRKDNTIRRSVTSETLSFISRKSSSESSTVDEQATELLKEPNEGDKVPELTSIKVDKPKPTLPNGRPMISRRFSLASMTLTGIGEPGTPKPKCNQLMRRVSFDMSILQDRRASSLSSRGSIQRRPSACEELVRDIFSKQDRKAARALAILVIVVTLCWAPNVIMKILLSIFPGILPHWSLVLSSWLVLLNSGLNPYLYATGNTKYKRGMRSCLGKRRPTLRHIRQEPFRLPSKYLSKQYLAVKLEHNILSNVILKPA